MTGKWKSTKKPKIIYIVDPGMILGGAYVSLLEILDYVKKENVADIVVLTPYNHAMEDELNERGIENYCIGHRQFWYNFGNTRYLKLFHTVLHPALKIRYFVSDFRAVLDAEKRIDFSTVDLIHSNLNRDDVGAILAWRHKIPHIWHIREFGEGDFNLHSYRCHPCKYMNRFPGIYLAVSKGVRNHWIGWGINPNRIHVFYNSVDTDEILPAVERNGNGKLRILFGGGICYEKGQWQILEAVNYLNNEVKADLEIIFFGNISGNYEDEWKHLIQRLDKKVQCSVRPYDYNYKSHINEYDIGINASISEAFGKVTTEYMSAGLCTIVTRTGANPELIDDGVDGFLFEYGDTKELAACIERVYYDRTLMHRIAQNGRRKVINKFSKDKQMKKLMKIYENCIRRGEK